jgi:hypothetical protein
MGLRDFTADKRTMPTITVDWSLAFQNSAATEAAAYWFLLRGDRQMPARRELSPSAMRGFLSFVNLVSIKGEGPDSYRLALQGQHTRDVFGHLAKCKLTEVLSIQEEQRWRECFDLARDSQKPVRLTTRVGTQGKLWLDCEVFMAPLADADGGSSIYWVFVSWPSEAASVAA